MHSMHSRLVGLAVTVSLAAIPAVAQEAPGTAQGVPAAHQVDPSLWPQGGDIPAQFTQPNLSLIHI